MILRIFIAIVYPFRGKEKAKLYTERGDGKNEGESEKYGLSNRNRLKFRA